MTAVEFPETRKLRNGTFFLLALSIALSSSIFCAILAPFPLTLNNLLRGRKYGYGAAVVGLLITVLLSWKILLTPAVSFFYLLAMFFSVLLTEIFIRKIHPIKGLLISTGICYGVLALLTCLLFLNLDQGPVFFFTEKLKALGTMLEQHKTSLLSSGGEEFRYHLDLLSKPGEFAKEIVGLLPVMGLFSVLTFLWPNLYLLLKTKMIYNTRRFYPYGEKEFIHFKMPETFIWPLMISFSLYLFGDEYLGTTFGFIGKNIFLGLIPFYFFHGFGIYIAFLDYFKIYGFLRSALIMLTLLFAFRPIAVIGLIDLWVNFEKFFKKKKKDS